MQYIVNFYMYIAFLIDVEWYEDCVKGIHTCLNGHLSLNGYNMLYI